MEEFPLAAGATDVYKDPPGPIYENHREIGQQCRVVLVHELWDYVKSMEANNQALFNAEFSVNLPALFDIGSLLKTKTKAVKRA